MLRERLWVHCAEKERDWENTVLRERLGEHCAEREIGGTLF